MTTKAMIDKSKQKRNNYNTSVIDKLEKTYGYSKTYIRWCIDGTRTGIMPDVIKKEYKSLCAKVEAALNNK